MLARVALMWKVYRWKFVGAVFIYYLVRDTVLYIIIPFAVINFLIGE